MKQEVVIKQPTGFYFALVSILNFYSFLFFHFQNNKCQTGQLFLLTLRHFLSSSSVIRPHIFSSPGYKTYMRPAILITYSALHFQANPTPLNKGHISPCAPFERKIVKEVTKNETTEPPEPEGLPNLIGFQQPKSISLNLEGKTSEQQPKMASRSTKFTTPFPEYIEQRSKAVLPKPQNFERFTTLIPNIHKF